MIQDLVEKVHWETVERCDVVSRALPSGGADARRVLPRQLGAERLFKALVTGNPGRLRDGPEHPEWVSWIEDVPPHYWLTQYDRVVIDLVPSTGRAFFAKYGMEVDDFCWWVRNHPSTVLINVRNDAWEDYAAPEVAQDMQRILSLAYEPDCARSFYRLQPIRERAFGILGIDFADLIAKARKATVDYRRPSEDAQERLRPVARDGRWMSPGALAGRIAYYWIAKQLWDGSDGFEPAVDEQLDRWLGDLDGPLDLDLSDEQMFDLQARLYTSHHLYTAHLTGALGGHYGWMEPELDFASSVRSTHPINRNRAHRLDLPSAEWLYKLEAGYLAKPGDAAAPFGEGQARTRGMTPFRWYVENSAENRRILLDEACELHELFGRAAQRIESRGGKLSEDERERINDLIDELAANRICLSRCLVSVLGVLGVALGTGGLTYHGWKLDEVGKILAGFATLLGQLGMQNRLAPVLRKLNAAHSARTDRNALIRIVNKLQLPPRSSG